MYSFDRDGIEIVQNIIPKASITTLVSMTDEILENPKNIEESVTVQSVVDAKPHKLDCVIPETIPTLPFIVSDLIGLNSNFAKYFMDTAILNVVAGKLKCSTNEIVYHFSNITSKPPKYGPVISLHRDFPNSYCCPEDSNFIRVLMPLDTMSGENGGLNFIPFSHKVSDEDARLKKGSKAKYVSADIKTIESKPGDLVLLNSKTLHGSAANRSSQPRRVLVVQYGLRHSSLAYSSDEYMSLETRFSMGSIAQ